MGQYVKSKPFFRTYPILSRTGYPRDLENHGRLPSLAEDRNTASHSESSKFLSELSEHFL
jgi:hypothetical protein